MRFIRHDHRPSKDASILIKRGDPLKKNLWHMQQKTTFEALLGALVLGAAIWFSVYIGTKTKAHKNINTYKLSAYFPSVDGLTEDAPVRIGGVRVGRIRSISLNPNNFMAKVVFDVQSTFSIPEDSSASVSSVSLLGGKFLNIQPGGSSKFLKHNAFLERTQGPVSLEKMISHFVFGLEKKE